VILEILFLRCISRGLIFIFLFISFWKRYLYKSKYKKHS